MPESIEKKPSHVLVWLPADSAGQERAGLPTFRSTGGTVLTPVKVDSNKIAGSIQELVQSLEPVLASSSSESGLSIDELELKLTVSANGEVGFLASVSAGVEACITLRMKRH